MDLSNENIVHVKKDGVEFLQFRRLLDYQEINHAYSLGIDKNYRTTRQETYQQAIKDYEDLCEAINSKPENLVKTNQEHTDKVAVVKKKINSNQPELMGL